MNEWYFEQPGGQPLGPYSATVLLQWIAAGQITADATVCAAGTQHWVPISEVPIFIQALIARTNAAAARMSRPSQLPAQFTANPLQTPPPFAANPSQPPPRPSYAQQAPPSPHQQPSYPPQSPAYRSSQPPPMHPSQPPSAMPGRPSAPSGVPSSQQKGATMFVPGLGAATAPQRARTMFGMIQMDDLSGLAAQRQAIIGRGPPADIVLPYPQVSLSHASVGRTPDGMLAITDLGSTNGTHVAGARINPGSPVKINPGDRVFIGPYPMIIAIEGNAIRAYFEHERPEWSGNLVEVEALDLVLSVPDRENTATDRVLLNHVTFKALPGDLIALMGPSGAGKTTLLTVLNGYLRPSGGEVRINGESLYAIYDALRGSIGYVPQDDIVHPELTVFEAIKFSAQFRLPPDYSDDEINRRVEQVVKDLGLEQVKNLEIGKPERKVLSGGQRKRVNIALELVTDPALMFLDEPTSGLAADDTVALIDLLSDLAKKQGKTIIVTIHQPAREEYEKFNLALVLGFGGEPLYFGPTGKASYEFFGQFGATKGKVIDNPRDMFDLLKQREADAMDSHVYPDRPSARLGASRAWRAEYYAENNPVYRAMYSGSRTPGKPSANPSPSRAHVPLLRQFVLLLQRYAIVKRRDRVGTFILLAQAPIIGILLALVFFSPAKAPNLWCKQFVQNLENSAALKSAAVSRTCLTDFSRFPKIADFSGAIFFLAIAAIWFGTSNAAREIVAEQAIYRRERMVNLSIVNYVMSKFTLLTLLCVVQCTVLLGIVFGALGLGDYSASTFVWMLFFMILTAMCSASIGLLISTSVVSSEAATALTPIALIPQVVLGGRMVPMTSKGWLEFVMALAPSRWSFEGLLAAERSELASSWKIKACVQSGTGITNGSFNCALEEMRNSAQGGGGLGFVTHDTPLVAALVLGSMTLAAIAVVMLLLKRRDSV